MSATALLLRNTVSPRSSVTITAWGSVSSARRSRIASALASATASAALSVARSTWTRTSSRSRGSFGGASAPEPRCERLKPLAQAAATSAGRHKADAAMRASTTTAAMTTSSTFR